MICGPGVPDHSFLMAQCLAILLEGGRGAWETEPLCLACRPPVAPPMPSQQTGLGMGPW